MVTDMALGLASFFAISKASEIDYSSTSSISLFRPKNILFSFHSTASLSISHLIFRPEIKNLPSSFLTA